MAMQIQNLLKNSTKFVGGVRAISSGSGIFSNGSDQMVNRNTSSKLHLAVQREYPKAASLPLPPNIDPAESSRFSPLRNRDINGSAMVTHHSNVIDIDVTLEQTFESEKNSTIYEDPHLESHDKNTPVSLNAVMQTTVPEPFSPSKFSHLNMPGGQWMQQTKFLSHELCSSHYTNLRQEVRASWNDYGTESRYQKGTFRMPLTNHLARSQINQKRFFSQNSNEEKIEKTDDGKKLSQREQFKKAIKDYGSVIVVFHIGISLVSLGICYTLVSSGLDVVAIINKLGLSEQLSSKVAANASTFVLAYAIHKLAVPIRMSITLGSAPFIVRYLRAKGILKAAKK